MRQRKLLRPSFRPLPPPRGPLQEAHTGGGTLGEPHSTRREKVGFLKHPPSHRSLGAGMPAVSRAGDTGQNMTLAMQASVMRWCDAAVAQCTIYAPY